ncbi:hypothetical protein KY359_06770 [Candidatus Woesearchaeota archaeon]|nr:hypothetical protein [Candidatus Woesearchaeota archaeon]
MPLALPELLRIVSRMEPTEPFLLNRINEDLLERFSIDADVSMDDENTPQKLAPAAKLEECSGGDDEKKDADGNAVSSISKQDMSPLYTDGSFFGKKKKEERPVELILHEGDHVEGESTVQTINREVNARRHMVSSLDMHYAFEECYEGKQDHYFRIRLSTKFNPLQENEEDIVASVHQMPYGLNILPRRIEYERMLAWTSTLLDVMTFEGMRRDVVVKSVFPSGEVKGDFLRELDELRKKYCRK